MEAVRMRPKVSAHRAAGYRRTQGSGMEGGIFANQATAAFYGSPPGGEVDFLSRLEEAEARDDNNNRHWDPAAAHNNRERAGQEYRSTLDHNKNSSIVFGDDSTAALARAPAASMYQTTNQQQQAQTQFMHEKAKERHEEQILMKLMVEDHGMTEKEARQEIALYRQEQAQAAARQGTSVPRAGHQAAQQEPRRGLQPNGGVANAHLAQQQRQQQMQAQRGVPSPQQQFMTMNQMQARYQQQQHQQQVEEELLQEQQRQQMQQQQQMMEFTRQPRNEFGNRYPVERHTNSPADVPAGARMGPDHKGVPKTREGGGRANRSALEGGIFAPGVWS